MFSMRHMLRQSYGASSRAFQPLAAPRASLRPLHLPRRPMYLETSRATNIHSLFSRRMISFRNTQEFNHRTFERLEAECSRGYNASAEASLMKELNKIEPKETVKRYESNVSKGHSPSEAMTAEYMRALIATGQWESSKMTSVLRNAIGADAKGRLNVSTSAPIPVRITAQPSVRDYSWIISLLGWSVVLYLVFSRFSNNNGSLFGINMNPKEMESADVSFDDVRGVKEAQEQLQEIVAYLRDPQQFTRLGAAMPKGLLLTGPPGTGKTLLARAIAGEAGVPFFYCTGSEFDEMLVGVGPRRIRTLFEQAKAKSPSIIFIDEIDSVGSNRQLRLRSETAGTLNQLLTELDGFEKNNGVIVIAATNFPDVLDPALTRPGRFDKSVSVPLPDVVGRKEILELYLSKVVTLPDVDVSSLARGTVGFSGADLANLVNVATIKATLRGLEGVSTECLDLAKDDVLMGVERKSAFLSEENRKLTAYHEGGHALVALYSEGAMPIHKATIVPRGRALGMVVQLPDEDSTSYSREQMMGRLAVAMGGRAAEELIFGEKKVTSGAQSDFKGATDLANRMITKWGMGERTGRIHYDETKDLSTETKAVIEQETNQLLQRQYTEAKTILTDHMDELHRLAKALLEHETLTREEIQTVVKGGVLPSRI